MSKFFKSLVTLAIATTASYPAFAQELREGNAWASGMTVVSKKIVHGVGRMSVIEKPRCVGDSVLYLDKPDYDDTNVSLQLRSETSKDGRYWVIVQDAHVRKLTLDAVRVEQVTDAKIVCYKQKFPRVEVSNGKLLYDGKVVEKREGKIYLDGQLMPGQ